ncbi:MAG: hypothetical protein E7280_02865 [Lachnospiraceae bacterium]|nr:hypothetical protein [Lachnospiraceae bacterium]
MKRMKKLMKKAAALLLVTCMTMSLPIAQAKPMQAQAGTTEKASTMKQLAKIVSKHGVKRDAKFTVKYTGNSKDIDKMMNDQDFTFFTSTLALIDDPSTSDDADYLAGNLNLSDDYDVYATGKTIVFKLKYFETKKQTQYVNSKIPGILKKLGVKKLSNYDKVKKIHDYVCKLITYKDDYKKCSSMYSALKNGKGLCNSYALCMYKLLTEAGVPCKFVGGIAGTGRDSGGHAWNIVKLDGKWYYLDATWDDEGKNKISHDYFLKGTSDFDKADPSQKHTLDKPYRTGEFAKKFPIAKKAYKKGSNEDDTVDDEGNDSDYEYDDTTDDYDEGYDDYDDSYGWDDDYEYGE